MNTNVGHVLRGDPRGTQIPAPALKIAAMQALTLRSFARVVVL
jgi:hypothetical protein